MKKEVPRVKRILFSQNHPVDFEKSPYADFVKLYNVKIDFYKFFQVEALPLENFLSQNISILDHTSIILTSKNAIDHFFRIVNELKISISSSINFFCTNEGTATYLQKYITRRRKAFFPEDGSPEKLVEEIAKHASDIFLLPMAMDSSINQLVKLLDEKEINYKKAEIFKISFPDMSKTIDIYTYNMVVFFSPYGIQSLKLNYPDFKQGSMVIGVFGKRAAAAAQKAGLNVQIVAPAPKHLSIFSAVSEYLRKSNPKDRKIKKKNTPLTA